MPNITGTIKFGYGESGSDPHGADGAFYGTDQGTRFFRNADSNTGWKNIRMDASRSSSIYGSSDTVTPLSESCRYIISY